MLGIAGEDAGAVELMASSKTPGAVATMEESRLTGALRTGVATPRSFPPFTMRTALCAVCTSPAPTPFLSVARREALRAIRSAALRLCNVRMERWRRPSWFDGLFPVCAGASVDCACDGAATTQANAATVQMYFRA